MQITTNIRQNSPAATPAFDAALAGAPVAAAPGNAARSMPVRGSP
jgi:hypothetical protein